MRPNKTLDLFVGHRFVPRYFNRFRRSIREALRQIDAPLRAVYADMGLTNGHLLRDKIQPMIDGSLFCLFDITEQDKPNVFIELGYAFGRGKHVVITSAADSPSDLAGLDMIRYQSFSNLRDQLATYLPQIVTAAFPTVANLVGELPPSVMRLLCENWRKGASTPKQAIYGSFPDRNSAEANIAVFVKASMLIDSNGSVSLTKEGARTFCASVQATSKT